ncbi:MAG: hypothetical protein IJ518_01920 [Clostridia bacterium]|nr:hypothetical protein [Clostridia bacterium]
MKKNNLFLKSLSLALVLILLVLTVGCGTGGNGESNDSSDISQSTTNQATTQTDGAGNVITDAPTTTQTDASGNVVTDAPATQTDASGNVITTTTVGGSGNKVTTTTGKVGTTAISYNKPAGNYNYIKDVIRYTVQFDCLADYDKDKHTLKVTQGGGPANFTGLFMDPAQTYVYRAKVTPSNDGMLARLIFKGNSMVDYMYLALEDGFVRVYDCADVYVGDAMVAIEIKRYDAPNMKEFSFKAGKTYDVAIMTGPNSISVWIDGKQYINNISNADFKDEGAAGNRAPANLDISKYPMSRFVTDNCYMGAYYVGKAGDVLTLTDIDIYYPTAGMDKNYIDDGSDTNYQSTYKQDKFYMAGSLNFSPMPDSGNFTQMATLLKGANINLAIPYMAGVYETNPNAFYDAFQKAGIDFIASDKSIYGINAMNAAQIEKNVKTLSGKYSHLIGYYIWDEPRTEKFWKVRKLGQLVTKVDPSAAVFTALLPSYSDYTWTTTDASLKYTNHISSFVSKVKPNVLSMDYYPFQQHGLSANMKTNGFWKDLGYLTYMANKNNIPYWHWISGVQEWEFGKSDQMTMEHMKSQINGSIAYGAKGVLIFGVNECIITNDLKKSTKYDAMAQLNKEAQNIGNLIFNAKRSAIYHTAGYTTPASAYLDDMKKSTVVSSAPSAGSGLIISLFTEGNKTYLVVYNKDYKAAVNGTIKLKKSYNVAEFNAATNKMGAASAKSEISINLDKAGIQVYQLT